MTKKTLSDQMKDSKKLFEYKPDQQNQNIIDIDNIKSHEEADAALDQIRERRKFEKTPEDREKNQRDFIKAFSWGLGK